MEWKWKGNRMEKNMTNQVEAKFNEMEWKWNGNEMGVGLVWKWNGNRVKMEIDKKFGIGLTRNGIETKLKEE